MSDQLKNSGPTPEYIDVVGPQGQSEQVSLMPRGKLTLPIGYTLDPAGLHKISPKVFVNDQPVNAQQGA